MDFTQLMSMLSPRPDMDPFAVGNALATDPEQLAPQLATMGPPPAQGQGFGDWLNQKLQSPMPQGGGGMEQAPGVGPVPSELSGTPSPFGGSPTAVSPLIAAGMTGVENVPGVGPVPTTGPAGTPTLGEAVTPPNKAIRAGREAEAPAAGVPLPMSRPAEADAGGEAKPDPEKMKKMQAALKGMGGLLQGVKAPPAPETQKISSPSAPRPTGQMGPSALMALVQQLQGSAPGTSPLRLGNALYAGGRGIY